MQESIDPSLNMWKPMLHAWKYSNINPEGGHEAITLSGVTGFEDSQVLNTIDTHIMPYKYSGNNIRNWTFDCCDYLLIGL